MRCFGCCGGNCVSGIPRYSWAVYLNHPAIGADCDLDGGMIVFGDCSNCVQLCYRQAMLFCLGVFLLHGRDVCSVCKNCKGYQVDQTLTESSWYQEWWVRYGDIQEL